MGKLLLLLVLAVGAWIWWRRRGRGSKKMVPSEARAVLGVAEGASDQEICEAHRRLIARVHPDTGGSGELASRVNAARDALLAELNPSPPRAS